MRFDKPKGQRLHKKFFGVCVDGMWWNPNERRWVTNYLDSECWDGSSTYFKCRSLRAFKRHLRKNPNIKGRATLRSLYVGFDVYA